MGRFLILILFLINFSLAGDNNPNTVAVPVPTLSTSIIVKLFYFLIGAVFSYWFYFILKNYVRYVLIAFAIYIVSLILLDYFHVIKLNINSVKDYITELLAIIAYFIKLIQSKLSFTFGVIVGLIIALYKDEVLFIPQPKKEKKK